MAQRQSHYFVHSLAITANALYYQFSPYAAPCGHPCVHMQSGSYNPVEEPSWLHSESFDITRYGVMDSIASSPRLHHEASNELASSLDRACHAALPRTPSSNTNTTVDELGSPSIGPPRVVESPRFSVRCSGGAGEDELQAYVMKKVRCH
jgi:hypothetical protein